MKKLLIIVLVSGFALSSSAQRFSHGGVYYGRPRVYVSTGFYAPFYPYYGYGLFGYPFYPYYGYGERPTKLGLQIEDIKNDYRDKIISARQDKSISRKERKKIIQKLKHDRDQAIINARRNYYKY